MRTDPVQLPAGTPAEVTRMLTALLEKSGLSEAPLLASWTVSEYTGLPRLTLLRQTGQPVAETAMQQIRSAADRLLAGEPLQYIFGYSAFMDLRLQVTPAVLIPRPETEQLISLILEQHGTHGHDRLTVADIGTGSGCIALALARHLPGADVHAVDVSAEALHIARHNAAQMNLADRVTFHQGSLLDPLPDHSCHLIAANLPYIPTGELSRLEPQVQQEPVCALDGGPDGLELVRKIIAEAPNKLCNGGYIYLEIAHQQAQDVQRQLLQSGFRKATVLKDYEEKDRYIQAAL